jgi:hypothetical protein
MISGGFGIVKNGLIRYHDIKDLFKDKGGFASGNSKGDMKSEDKAENIRAMMNILQLDFAGSRSGMG